jgi:hypothetical protein
MTRLLHVIAWWLRPCVAHDAPACTSNHYRAR